MISKTTFEKRRRGRPKVAVGCKAQTFQVQEEIIELMALESKEKGVSKGMLLRQILVDYYDKKLPARFKG